MEIPCEDYICKFKQGAYDTFCASNNASDKYNCRYCKNSGGHHLCDYYDENGVRIGKYAHCNSEYKNCKLINIYKENGSTLLSTEINCDENGENCLYKLDNIVSNGCSGIVDLSCKNKAYCHSGVCDVYNENGVRTIVLDECQGNATYDYCKRIRKYSDDGEQLLTDYTYTDTVNGMIYSSYSEPIYDSNGTMTGYKRECNAQGYCGWIDTYNAQGNRTIKTYYNKTNGSFKSYDENIYAEDGVTITGTRTGCNQQGVCKKCTGTGCD